MISGFSDLPYLEICGVISLRARSRALSAINQAVGGFFIGDIMSKPVN